MVDLLREAQPPVVVPPVEQASAGETTRRGFLGVAVTGVATVAVGAAVAGDVFAASRGVFSSGSGPAYEPWQLWQRGSAPLRLVAAAILAANAHNAQAWRFEVGPQRIDVIDDLSRTLGTVDAYRREVQISAGCAIENIALAAQALGLAATVTAAPTSDRTLLARIDLAPTPPRVSSLYRAIPLRHTDRSAYHSGRRLPSGIIQGLDALVDRADIRLLWLLSPTERRAFSALTVAATEAFIADPEQVRDDSAWYRSTSSEIQMHRDGITPDAAGLSPLVRSIGKLLPATSATNNAYWLSGTRDRQLPTASGFAIVLVRDAADVAQRLGAGRLYQRMQLWATTKGLAMQPLNQAVERAERERVTGRSGPIRTGLTRLVGDSAWQPVMPMRIGYPTTPAPASPRRALAAVITRGTS
ncbi:MAG: hypothetical protein QOE37_690 [Microbacteriaceae bacterium]|jgi:hypothetical protein|nr:hypothetical protein [Microbacteriaceae bacterium]